MNRQKLVSQIRRYVPYNEQEEADKALILNWIEKNDDAFLRDNVVAHMTASAWVVDKDRSKVLMVYHNIYHSWSWLGGHADGETDLLAVAIREVKEEAGISNVHPVSEEIFSMESLTIFSTSSFKSSARIPSPVVSAMVSTGVGFPDGS